MWRVMRNERTGVVEASPFSDAIRLGVLRSLRFSGLGLLRRGEHASCPSSHQPTPPRRAVRRVAALHQDEFVERLRLAVGVPDPAARRPL
jgi:hypothetical protein